MALFAKQEGYKNLFVPKASANEAAVLENLNVYGVNSLMDLVNHLKETKPIEVFDYKEVKSKEEKAEFDMSKIIGQSQAKRAAEIAATGGHNFLMIGSPGSGKTMLARSIPGIMPHLNEKESLEVTKLYSISGKIPPNGSLVKIRPFRAPHHTISRVGLIGGGTRPKPGEISLAHNGVLFLDEFNEFPRSVLESLRQPIEDGHVTISRSREQASYPAGFMLVASANPCPCGYLNHKKKSCSCTPREIEKYKKRVSGPILDRIDLHVEVPSVDVKKLSKESNQEESSKKIKKRVKKARNIQEKRFSDIGILLNSNMKNKHIKKFCNLKKDSKRLLVRASSKYQLSARAYYKLIKISRTIADLEKSKEIQKEHVAEALQYRARSYKHG